MLIDAVRSFCLTHQLFASGPVVVAVSGGADSLTLLHVLHTLSAELAIIPHAVSFDHQIRGDASAADVAFVRSIADTWGIPFFSGRTDVPALARTQHIGIEAAARQARYEFLARTAEQIGATVIATGHNQDDQAETVLLHLIRGAGLAGLRGMAPKSRLPRLETDRALTLVRPLLETPRTEIDRYLRELGIQPRHDTTNDDPQYTRNKIRHEVLPLLATINPQVRSALARSAQIIREDYAALEQTLPRLGPMRRSEFVALQSAQQRLFIRLSAQQIAPGTEISFERTAAAIQLATGTRQRGAVQLSEEVWLHVSGQMVSFSLAANVSGLEQPLPIADCPWLETGQRITILADQSGTRSYPLPYGWQLRVDPMIQMSQNQPAPLEYHDPLMTILHIPASASLVLRTSVLGDRLRPHGMGGHAQKLRDLFTNLKVPLEWRNRIPVLTVNGEVAWVILPTLDGSRSRIAEAFASGAAENADFPLWRFSFRHH